MSFHMEDILDLGVCLEYLTFTIYFHKALY
jgi:hypothetical protein